MELKLLLQFKNRNSNMRATAILSKKLFTINLFHIIISAGAVMNLSECLNLKDKRKHF